MASSIAEANLRTLGILFVALTLAGTAVAGPLEDGVEAVNRGDYATALQLLRPLAEQGEQGTSLRGEGLDLQPRVPSRSGADAFLGRHVNRGVT